MLGISPLKVARTSAMGSTTSSNNALEFFRQWNRFQFRVPE